MIVLRCLLCGVLIFFACNAWAQDAKSFVRRAVQSELKADAGDNSHWLYYETDQKPSDSVEQWVAETSKGSLRRVVKKNGQAIPLNEQRGKMQEFVESPEAQAKQRHDGRHDDKQATQMLKLLPNAFIWTDKGTQGENRILHFQPDPKFHPPNYEARVFAAMEGDMVVNTSQLRIASLKGHLIHEVKFGLGILGELKQGGTFDVERRNIGQHVWVITESHINVHGHALLFKNISEQEDDVKSKFERLPGNLSLHAAEKKLLEQTQ
ncbi:MAG: hypothetical protein WB439_03025 [Acidobacteriaceae bacterium]